MYKIIFALYFVSRQFSENLTNKNMRNPRIFTLLEEIESYNKQIEE